LATEASNPWPGRIPTPRPPEARPGPRCACHDLSVLFQNS
jgi:hypothetical protein